MARPAPRALDPLLFVDALLEAMRDPPGGRVDVTRIARAALALLVGTALLAAGGRPRSTAARR